MTRTSLFNYVCVAIIALWMLVGGVAHFIVPEFFYPLVPDFLPKWEVVILSGIPEILIGLGVLWPRTRALAGLGFTLLCLAFLPLHIWDLFRDNPAITPYPVAVFRVFLQFVLMWIGWQLWRQRSASI